MRDRLIALAMRRPIHIKDEDFDVPMLLESDFEIQRLPDDIEVVPQECTLMRDVSMQREFAAICIAKANLCLCIGHIFKTQCSVRIRNQMDIPNTDNSSAALFHEEGGDNADAVQTVDQELNAWAASLPDDCQYKTMSRMAGRL